MSRSLHDYYLTLRFIAFSTYHNMDVSLLIENTDYDNLLEASTSLVIIFLYEGVKGRLDVNPGE